MAYVVARAPGTWELRESLSTPTGPRARTLATFRTLDSNVLEHAADRAERSFDVTAVRSAALRAGAPVARNGADEVGAKLLHQLWRGKRSSGTITRMLIAALGGDAMLTEAEVGAAEWIGASSAERGEALRDLLGLADALPSRREGDMLFPGLKPKEE